MATEPQPAPASEDLAAVLCRISETYGRGICREPQRVAAMLKDLCPERRRESFLLVSALREHVVADLVGMLDSVPEDMLVERSVGKLRDNLGLSEDSARWAVESWIPACRVLATAPDRPLRFETPETGPLEVVQGVRRPVDWAWLGLCLGAVASVAAALGVMTRFTFYHYWASFRDWSMETLLLVSSLAACGFALAAVARGFRGRKAPNQRALDPNRAAGAMLVEVVTLLALPLAPTLAVGMWAAEWIGELHVMGQPHDLSFHLGRMLQSLAVAGFVYAWVRSMIAIQGRIASSMVRLR